MDFNHGRFLVRYLSRLLLGLSFKHVLLLLLFVVLLFSSCSFSSLFFQSLYRSVFIYPYNIPIQLISDTLILICFMVIGIPTPSPSTLLISPTFRKKPFTHCNILFTTTWYLYLILCRQYIRQVNKYNNYITGRVWNVC